MVPSFGSPRPQQFLRGALRLDRNLRMFNATIYRASVQRVLFGAGVQVLSLSAGVAAFTNTSQGLLVATAIILGMTLCGP